MQDKRKSIRIIYFQESYFVGMIEEMVSPYLFMKFTITFVSRFPTKRPRVRKSAYFKNVYGVFASLQNEVRIRKKAHLVGIFLQQERIVFYR